MSFILDALKKSEAERQQSSRAEFAAVPTNPVDSSVPRWLWVVGALLAINLAVLAGLFLRVDNAAEPAVTSARIDTPTIAQTNSKSFEDQVAAAKLNPPMQSENLTTEEVPAPRTQSAQDVQAVLISQDPSSVSANQLYPTLQEIRARGALNLPDLHLDIHVYSEVPADRFAFINMSKIREGSRLDEGPAVVEITVDGVVLRHLGKTFLVPRD